MNLNQVTIPSTNLAVSVPFYRRLGLIQIVDSSPRYARFQCPEGNSTFSIHLTERLQLNPDLVIYFECEDLDAEVKRLKEDGFEFEMEPTDQTWLWREAYLRDPDGNRICLYKAGQNRLYPPWRMIP